MTENKPDTALALRTPRERVLAAAERLLGDGSADFSMRDLAAAADVSFATPFNQFGSKLAIMHALSAQRVERMHARIAAAALPGDTAQRIIEAVTIAAAVMTEMPGVNRAVMAAIGAPAAEPGDVRARSRALWVAALGDAAGLAPRQRALGRAILPAQLAIAFRGALSFWTAGEIGDEELRPHAVAAAATLLFGFVGEPRRQVLAGLMRPA